VGEGLDEPLQRVGLRAGGGVQLGHGGMTPCPGRRLCRGYNDRRRRCNAVGCCSASIAATSGEVTLLSVLVRRGHVARPCHSQRSCAAGATPGFPARRAQQLRSRPEREDVGDLHDVLRAIRLASNAVRPRRRYDVDHTGVRGSRVLLRSYSVRVHPLGRWFCGSLAPRQAAASRSGIVIAWAVGRCGRGRGQRGR
jgi:hypothetical protein